MGGSRNWGPAGNHAQNPLFLSRGGRPFWTSREKREEKTCGGSLGSQTLSSPFSTSSKIIAPCTKRQPRGELFPCSCHTSLGLVCGLCWPTGNLRDQQHQMMLVRHLNLHKNQREEEEYSEPFLLPRLSLDHRVFSERSASCRTESTCCTAAHTQRRLKEATSTQNE
jgi:hypothetical protein